MSRDPIQQIADAVLYEGYMLWPYRRSALKNQQRFTFGCVYPRAFAAAWSERSEIASQCLLELSGSPELACVEVELRCLHLVDRRPARRTGDALEDIDELMVGDHRYLAWQEATEQVVRSGPIGLAELLAGRRAELELPAGETVEELGQGAVLRRSWEALSGTLSIGAAALGEGLLRLMLRLCNTTGSPAADRAEAQARAFLSAHFVVRCRQAAFVSQTDPPERLAGHAAECRSEGLWPVLVGEPGQRDTLLAAPIILGDYPRVAPESPGDLFDGGEIDALLIHSLRGLTDQERDEIRATDPRVRELLDRSLALEPDRMLDLYGAVREMRPVEDA